MSIRSAGLEAKKSKHKQHRMGAVIVKGGRIIAFGHNKLRPSKELKTETIHAEEDAVLQGIHSAGISSLAGAKLYVTRYTKGGSVGLSRPCNRCMGLLHSVGIKRVIYTTNYGYTESIKL